jgi:polyisoprenoid-binding protein YceI
MMTKWVIDPDHSVAAFSVRHMMISDVHGQFNRITGVVRFDTADISRSSVEAEIGVAGIYTGIQKRDDHLRSPDFFDVVKYPVIRFKSDKTESLGANRFTVEGSLTMKGVTRPVTLEAEYTGPVKDPFEEGGMSMGFTASVTVNREDYGIMWNADMEGGVIVGKNVRIILNIEADRSAD